MGLIDGVYAIAMTLIAIELPALTSQLLQLGQKKISPELVAMLISYELVAYIATFMLLYEFWTVHKSILKQGGLTRQMQNLTNGTILAVTCVGAGNIILLLKEKTDQAVNNIKADVSHLQLMHDWINNHSLFSLATFLLIALMYWLMSLLGQSSKTHQTSEDLRHLTRSLRHRSKFFLISSLLWTPLIFGGSLVVPPAIIVISFLAFNFNQPSLSAFIKNWRSHI